MGWSLFRPTGLTHRNADFSGGYTLVTPIGGDATYLLDEDGTDRSLLAHARLPARIRVPAAGRSISL